jgi:undecaprenyl-phosphate 4-deoxy-4-formamido-L-arabinose transferase
MDDDLQHLPEDIPRLLEQIDSGFDVVYAKFINRHHPLWKIAGSHLNNLVAAYLIKKPIDLYLSPFRAFRSFIKDEIIKYQGPYVYIDGLILSVTKNISSVQVEHQPRYDGNGYYGFRKSISLWLKMATSFSVVPLRITSIAGMVISFIGFLLAFFLVVQKLMFDSMPIGWSSLIVTILIIGGIQLLAIGMVGEYLGRVLLTINSRSQFLIAETISLDNRTRSH